MSKYIKVDDLQTFCDNQASHSITPNDFQRMNCIEIVKCKNCKYCKQQEGQEQKQSSLFNLDFSTLNEDDDDGDDDYESE